MTKNAYRLCAHIDLVSYCGRMWEIVSILYYRILLIFKPFNGEASVRIGLGPAYPFIERLISYGYNNFIAWALNPLKTP